MNSIEKAVERLRKMPGGDGGDKGEAARRPAPASSFAPAGAKTRRIYHVDLERLERMGFVTPKSERTQNVKEFQVLKRPLLVNAFDQGAARGARANLIMVTSPLAGEGKTYVSLNLAMSIAMEKDTTILMVDSDVIKLSLTHLLGLENEPGLTDVLIDSRLGIGDVIVSTDIPRLKVVPAGRTHLHSTELLASEYMKRLANEISERYPDRIVLFDGPPQLATSEAAVLAQLAGQILVVVEEGKTPQKAVKEAVAQIGGNKIVGLMLNKCRHSFGTGYYGYGYGKGHAGK